MLTLEQAVTIQILHQQGLSIKGISRELGGRNTVRKYLRHKETHQYRLHNLKQVFLIHINPIYSNVYMQHILNGFLPLCSIRKF